MKTWKNKKKSRENLKISTLESNTTMEYDGKKKRNSKLWTGTTF
jgi:hypothetical protein